MNIENIINKKFGEGTIKKASDAKEKVLSIPTPSYTINYHSGIGGIGIGYQHEIYGAEASGKSALCQGIVANAQKMGLRCLYIDAENRFQAERALQFGINIEDLYLMRETSIESVFNIIPDVLRSGEFQVIVVDSIPVLMSDKEFEEDMETMDMGKKAQALGKGLKKVIGVTSEIKSLHPDWVLPTVIYVNQVRNGPDKYTPEFVPGGRAFGFFCSQIIRLQASKYIDADDKEYSIGANATNENNLIGVLIAHRHKKNTFSPPARTGSYKLYWDERCFDNKEELFELALQIGIVKYLSKMSLQFRDYDKIVGIENMKKFLLNDPQKFQELESDFWAIAKK